MALGLGAALLAAAGAALWYHFGADGSLAGPKVRAMLRAHTSTQVGWPVSVHDVARGFADPYGVVLDRDGNAYVSDGGEANAIYRVGRDGAVTLLAGGREGYADGTGAAASFHTPSGLAIDGDGNLLVADTGNNAIRKVTMQGVVSTLAGNGVAGALDGPGASAQFNGPVGVAVDRTGTVFVADTYNDRIRRIGPDGSVSTVAGGPEPGFADGAAGAARFDTPTGLALDKAGNLFIADTFNGAVRKLAPDGTVSTLALSNPDEKEPLMRRPLSLAVTHDGFLYIGDMSRGRVLQLTPAGELRGLTGVGVDIAVGDAKPVRLGRAAGLALHKDGELVVADAPRRVLRHIGRREAAAMHAQVVPGQVPALAAAAALAPSPAAATFPWPLAPQDARHEVVGVVGEVRGSYDGESRHHFHNGLDMQAAMGAPVLAVANEKVTSPLPNGEFGSVGESLGVDQFAYVHMRVGRTVRDTVVDPERFVMLTDDKGKPTRVRVKRGTRFKVGDTVGTVNRLFHVHLIHRTASGVSNPMALPFPHMQDTIAPRIEAITLHGPDDVPLARKAGKRLLVPRSGGPLSIVMEAYDQADGNAARRKLGLYKAGYQIMGADGVPLAGFERPVINIEFNQLPPDDASVQVAYANNSGITVYGSARTRFLYVLTNRVRDGAAATGSWDPASLQPGDYTIRVFAADYAGNEATGGRELAIRVE